MNQTISIRGREGGVAGRTKRSQMAAMRAATTKTQLDDAEDADAEHLAHEQVARPDRRQDDLHDPALLLLDDPGQHREAETEDADEDQHGPDVGEEEARLRRRSPGRAAVGGRWHLGRRRAPGSTPVSARTSRPAGATTAAKTTADDWSVSFREPDVPARTGPPGPRRRVDSPGEGRVARPASARRSRPARPVEPAAARCVASAWPAPVTMPIRVVRRRRRGTWARRTSRRRTSVVKRPRRRIRGCGHAR